MKLKFKNQEFQTDAVNAVINVFDGQKNARATFSIDSNEEQQKIFHTEYGVRNVLQIDNDTLISNMHKVQRGNKLSISRDFDTRQYSVEMETGTGKTYVYIKTILELNAQYNFTKFIIVVPSVAIREGVYKSFQVTEEHFRNLYDSVPYRYFIYNSSRPNDIKRFVKSENIEIMIINIDAFKKAENIFNQQTEKLQWESPLKWIQSTNPVVIIDEPQSVDNTPKSERGNCIIKSSCSF